MLRVYLCTEVEYQKEPALRNGAAYEFYGARLSVPSRAGSSDLEAGPG